MITYFLWKELIEQIKEEQDNENFMLFLIFILLTPLFIILDIITIPIQILSFIYLKIQGEDKDVKE